MTAGNSSKFREILPKPKIPFPGIRSGRFPKKDPLQPLQRVPAFFQPFFPQKPAPGSRLSHGPDLRKTSKYREILLRT